MPSLSRRSVLCLSGVGLAGLSGCADFVGLSEPPQPVDLELWNYHVSPHTVHVRFLDGDDRAFDRSFDLPAADESGASTVWVDDYPTERREYVVRAWRDDQSAERAATLDFAESEADCLGLSIHVGEAETDRSDVTIWHTINCAERNR